MSRVLVVTGTDTDVGKTVATAALAAALGRTGSVAVDKPVQTGVRPGEPGDVEEVARLAGVADTSVGARLTRPMAPVQAARHEGAAPAALPTLAEHVARIAALTGSTEGSDGSDGTDAVLVEGSGGLLVQLDESRHTIADLADALRRHPGLDTSVVVVARAGLGTLNHTELTLEALRARGLPVAGIVIGSWPREPDEIVLDNRDHLGALGVPLLGAIPEGAPRLAPETFRREAPGWLPGLVSRPTG